jgi:putative acetyltransferase
VPTGIEVTEGGLDDPSVHALLEEHLADMHATSPPESVHALDLGGLTAPGVTFWTARLDGEVVGCVALKELSPTSGELKSMRTSSAARGRGIGTALLSVVLDEARRRGYRDVSLETGTQDFFGPAHRLYRRHGFTECGPFGDYVLDPHSTFMTLDLM